MAQRERGNRRAGPMDDGASRSPPGGLCLRRGLGAEGRRGRRREPDRHRHVPQSPESDPIRKPEPPGRRLRLRHLLPGRRASRRRRRHSRRPAPATRRRPRRVPVGDVPHHLHQRRRSARPGLRRLPGALPIRAGRPAGRQLLDRRTAVRPVGRRRRSGSVRTCASRSSRSSPKRTFSARIRRATTSRGNPTTSGCGSGRFPAPLMPTTTRSKWRRSTPARRRSTTSWRPTRRPRC